MAAQALADAGIAVDLFDGMPSVGRKFLLAGKGGLNLTHSEPIEPFLGRYGAAREHIAPWLREFGPDALGEWAKGLGVDTFVGSSGRVFPIDLKAAPLLRQHAPDFVFEAFCRSRLGGDWGQAFGTLGAATAFDAIISRAMPT